MVGTDPAATAPGPTKAARSPVARRVFVPSALLIGALVVATALAPEMMSKIFGSAITGTVRYFGWWYILFIAACILFTLWLGTSRYASIRLGRQEDRPEFSRISWYAMLFSAGIGIGVLFYGTAEAVTHYNAPPRSGAAGAAETIEAARYGVHITWMEWGAGAFAVYVVTGLGIALATHRRGRPLAIRWALEPILGDRVKGWMGDAIDSIAVLSTVLGLATSLGLGALQLNTGLEFLGIADISVTTQVLLIFGIALVACISVVSGVARGIKWLSNANVGLAGLLLVFVLVAGPTKFLLEATVGQVGYYLQNIIQSSFETDFSEGDAWQSAWTTFFWAWWVAWAPFVGVFLARISKGRTIREFALGVLVLPSSAIFIWFSVMGWGALNREIGDGGLGGLETEQVLFEYLNGLPFGAISATLAIVLIVTFFITSSDSGALVVSMLSSGGSTRPSAMVRVFWVVVLAAVAAVLSVAGGLSALQTASLVGGLPFSGLIVLMTWGSVKELHTILTSSPTMDRGGDVAAHPYASGVSPQLDFVTDGVSGGGAESE